MNLKFEDKVDSDLEKFSEELQIRLLDNTFDLEDDPLPENSYVIYLPDGSEVQCLKLQKEDRNSELNHRVTYDIVNNEFIRIYGIFERKPGYENIKEKTERRL